MEMESDNIKEDGWLVRNIKKICSFFRFKRRNEVIAVKTLDDTMQKIDEE